MTRLGFAPQERTAVFAAVSGSEPIDVLFIMSPLASADERDGRQNAEQLAEMKSILNQYITSEISFANSADMFLGSEYEGVIARPGVVLYGGAPMRDEINPMEPVVRLEVAVIQTRTVPAGIRVGYGGAYAVTAKSHLATISAGYADRVATQLEWPRRRLSSWHSPADS